MEKKTVKTIVSSIVALGTAFAIAGLDRCSRTDIQVKPDPIITQTSPVTSTVTSVSTTRRKKVTTGVTTTPVTTVTEETTTIEETTELTETEPEEVIETDICVTECTTEETVEEPECSRVHDYTQAFEDFHLVNQYDIKNTYGYSEYDILLLRRIVCSEYGAYWIPVSEKAKIVASVIDMTKCKDMPSDILGCLKLSCEPYGFNPYSEDYLIDQSVCDAVDYYFQNKDTIFANWTCDSWGGSNGVNYFEDNLSNDR